VTEAIVSEKPVREIATYVIRGFMQMAVDQVVHREGGEDEHHRIVMSDDLQGLPGMPELGSQPLGSMFAAPGLSEQGIPDSMFVDLVGLDHQRSVVLTCLQSQGTLHCLLYGPPGTGKSAITDEVAKIPGAESMTGANTTGPGLASVLLQEPAPPVVIIEEVDNLNPSGYGTLQRAMDGVVTRTRDQGHEERQIHTVFLMTANRPERIHLPIRRRMVELEVPALNAEQRKAVILNYLKREGIEGKTAEEISTKVAAASGDLRDAIQIAEAHKHNPAVAKEMAARLVPVSPTPSPAPRRRHRA